MDIDVGTIKHNQLQVIYNRKCIIVGYENKFLMLGCIPSNVLRSCDLTLVCQHDTTMTPDNDPLVSALLRWRHKDKPKHK